MKGTSAYMQKINELNIKDLISERKQNWIAG